MDTVRIKQELLKDTFETNGIYRMKFKEEPELIIKDEDPSHIEDEKIVVEQMEDKILVLINEDKLSDIDDDCSEDPLQVETNGIYMMKFKEEPELIIKDKDSIHIEDDYNTMEDDISWSPTFPQEEIVQTCKNNLEDKSSCKNKFICDFCGYVSSRSERIKVHRRMHTGEKPYCCHVCGFRASQKVNLNRHLMTHSTIKVFSCPLCDYKGNNFSYLKVHMRIHSKEKPFVCEICNYRTGVKGHLNVHKKRHSNMKTLACSHCDYKTSIIGDLKVHLRRHTGEKTFACDLCPYRTYLKSILKRHMKRHGGLCVRNSSRKSSINGQKFSNIH